MQSTAISARDVSILYRTDVVRVACSGVSVDVGEHEFVSLVGPSGCGKTSFLMACGGLVPIASGSLDVRDSASIVFQDPSLLPWRRVDRNVEYALQLQGVPKAERRARAREALSMVGLEQFGSAYPGALSGGMKQRANLARALVIDSQLLLCDEPFGALDAQTREVMQAELVQVVDRTSKACLFVTHDIGEAVYLSDRVLLFSRRPGRVIDVLEIDLPRPRTREVRKYPEFQAYCDRLWNGLVEGGGREEVTSLGPADGGGVSP